MDYGRVSTVNRRKEERQEGITTGKSGRLRSGTICSGTKNPETSRSHRYSTVIDGYYSLFMVKL